MLVDDGTKCGTIGGTMLIFFCNIGVDDLVKTVVLTSVGAVVSFCVSLMMKYFVKKFLK